MPAVDVAMQRSLREGFMELLIASLRPALTKRMDVASVEGQINDAKTAFSSWDNCMQASFCKWPVIAVIIVGGLIIFSVVWCIIRCACCGMSCCCSCFSCLKCCGDCCGCCDPPQKRAKYLDDPYVPPDQGYKAPAPMLPFSPAATMPSHAHAMPPPPGLQTGVTPQYSAPQYAEFDVSKKPHNEDALPAMPSWEGAESKKIMVEEEAVEMDQLKKPEASSAQNLAGPAGAVGAAGAVSAVGAVGMGGRGPNPGISPGNRSPYGPPGPAPGSNGYFPAPGMDNDPYAQQGQDYHQNNGPYGQNQGLTPNQGYGMAVGGPVGQGRQSPLIGGYNNGPMGQDRRSPPNGGYNNNGPYGPPARQGSYDTYGNRPPPRQASPYHDDYNQQQMGDYNQQQTRGPGYGMGGPGPRRSPPAMQMGGGPGGYGPDQDYGSGFDDRPTPSRDYSSESTRPLRAPPRRQYSRDVAEPAMPALPAQDSGMGGGGFDFGPAAYSRPTPNNNYRQPEPQMPEPQQPQQSGGGAYPGYKAYQPGR
ncbi:hypothetical protein V8F33_000169 [Rhypophila sp. PSN 637]